MQLPDVLQVQSNAAWIVEQGLQIKPLFEHPDMQRAYGPRMLSKLLDPVSTFISKLWGWVD